jgi:hypothetical protein
MATIEEMTVWTIEEINAQAEILLPAGWTLAYGADPQSTQPFSCQVKDDSGAVVKASAGPDQRVAMLDVYFWLFTRNSMGTRRTIWNRRPDPRLRPQPGRKVATGYGPEVPDPDDLNPAAIRHMVEKKHTSD